MKWAPCFGGLASYFCWGWFDDEWKEVLTFNMWYPVGSDRQCRVRSLSCLLWHQHEHSRVSAGSSCTCAAINHHLSPQSLAHPDYVVSYKRSPQVKDFLIPYN